MPAITTLGFAAVASIRQGLAALERTLVRRMKKLARAIEHRREMQVLARFDDRMLADIGLNRSDVQDAASGSMWSDPTTVLRARALERRMARHGIKYGVGSNKAVAPSIVPNVDSTVIRQARVAFCHNP